MKKEAQETLKEHEDKWRFTSEQPEGTKETWRMVSETPEAHKMRGKEWDPKIREGAARHFFQVWNTLRGKGVDSYIQANEPLRCSVWRYRVLNFDRILQDLMKEEGLIPYYTRAFETIYPELESRAQSDPALARRLQELDTIMGKGHSEFAPLTKRLTETQERTETKIQEQTYERNISSAEDVIHLFYKALDRFPALQEKYLNMIVDDAYTDFERKVGANVLKTGFYAGSVKVRGESKPNKMLTFYLMQDPFPYLESVPVKATGERYKNVDEILADYPQGAPAESPIKGEPLPGGSKTVQQFFVLKSPKGTFYVQNAQNPKYDFTTFDSMQVRKQEGVKTQVRKMVQDLQKQALFGKVFLGKNVLQESPGFEDKERMPGISLLDVGEMPGREITEEERDLTQMQDGGLFWVPQKGLPNPLKKKEPEEKGPYRLKGNLLPPSKQLFAQALTEVFGQATSDVWVDEQGGTFDTMDELLQAATMRDWEEAKPHLRNLVKGYVHHDLMRPASVPQQVRKPVPSKKILTPTFQEEEMEETEVPEEEMALAAKTITRLVKIANALDQRGLHKEADLVDNIVQEFLKDIVN